MSLALARNPRGQAVQYARHPNLVGWWRMGGNLRDSSGNGNDGTVGTGSAAYAPGVFGRAAAFDPSGFQYADTPVTLGDEFSVSLWVKINSTVNGYFVNQWQSGHPARFIIGEDGGNLFAVVGSEIYREAAPNNVWIHAVLLRTTAGLLTFYLNGGQVGQITNTSAMLDLTFQIGGTDRRGARNSHADIDDVRIYNCALTPNDIRRVMAGQQATGDYT